MILHLFFLYCVLLFYYHKVDYQLSSQLYAFFSLENANCIHTISTTHIHAYKEFKSII